MGVNAFYGINISHSCWKIFTFKALGLPTLHRKKGGQKVQKLNFDDHSSS